MCVRLAGEEARTKIKQKSVDDESTFFCFGMRTDHGDVFVLYYKDDYRDMACTYERDNINRMKGKVKRVGGKKNTTIHLTVLLDPL